jgi:hypothetical protein
MFARIRNSPVLRIRHSTRRARAAPRGRLLDGYAAAPIGRRLDSLAHGGHAIFGTGGEG